MSNTRRLPATGAGAAVIAATATVNVVSVSASTDWLAWQFGILTLLASVWAATFVLSGRFGAPAAMDTHPLSMRRMGLTRPESMCLLRWWVPVSAVTAALGPNGTVADRAAAAVMSPVVLLGFALVAALVGYVVAFLVVLPPCLVIGGGWALLTGRARPGTVGGVGLGLLLCNVVVVAVCAETAYRTPRRRDLLPLVGIVRDGTVVVDPVLLWVGRGSVATMVVLVAALYWYGTWLDKRMREDPKGFQRSLRPRRKGRSGDPRRR